MWNSLKLWWKEFRGRHECNKCTAKLDDFGYCFPCNTYPHKQYMTEEEHFLVDDEDFRRKHPEKYEELERASRRASVEYFLKRRTMSRDSLVWIYGEELVAELELKLKP